MNGHTYQEIKGEDSLLQIIKLIIHPVKTINADEYDEYNRRILMIYYIVGIMVSYGAQFVLTVKDSLHISRLVLMLIAVIPLGIIALYVISLFYLFILWINTKQKYEIKDIKSQILPVLCGQTYLSLFSIIAGNLILPVVGTIISIFIYAWFYFCLLKIFSKMGIVGNGILISMIVLFVLNSIVLVI